MTGDDLAARLYTDILDIWGLLLRQESWSLKTSESAFQVVIGSALSPVDDMDHSDDVEGRIDGMEIDNCEKAIKIKPVSEALEPGNWDQVRLFLSNERDRLCLWKANITDDELNKVTSNQSSILGGSVLESLLSIAGTLLSEINPKGPQAIIERSKSLKSLCVEGEKKISRHEALKPWDRVSLLSRDTGTTIGLGGEGLLGRLSEDIWRLERLSYSISLELAFGRG